MGTIGDVVRALPPKTVITIEDDHTLGDAVETFKQHGISQLPCTSGGRLSGIITETDVLEQLVHGREPATPLAEVMVRKVSTVAPARERRRPAADLRARRGRAGGRRRAPASRRCSPRWI